MAVGGEGGEVLLINTGFKEIKQIDSNPNSPTFGQFRWISGGADHDLCPLPRVPVYASEEIQRVVFRQNCGVGYIAGSAIYTIPAAMFTSFTSQAAANQLAEDEFYATAFAYANTHAACIPETPEDGGGGGIG